MAAVTCKHQCKHSLDQDSNIGLSDEEEDAIVAFMNALSDGFKVKSKGKTK